VIQKHSKISKSLTLVFKLAFSWAHTEYWLKSPTDCHCQLIHLSPQSLSSTDMIKSKLETEYVITLSNTMNCSLLPLQLHSGELKSHKTCR